MTAQDMKRASAEEIKRMRRKGELHHDSDAPDGESLGPDFWARAEVKSPEKPRSVHLKLPRDVFDFFYKETNGKGHLTRMQNVLKAYVESHRN